MKKKARALRALAWLGHLVLYNTTAASEKLKRLVLAPPSLKIIHDSNQILLGLLAID